MALADFIDANLPFAQKASSETGLPVDYILAQSALETGNGTSNASRNNNFFGISPGGTLASYPSPQAGFDAYSSLVNSRYSGASAFVSQGPKAIGDYMNGNGYSTTPDYGTRVAGLVSSVDDILSHANMAAGVFPASAGGETNSIKNSSASCGVFDFRCHLNDVGDWLGSGLTRVTFIIFAVILIIGAVIMFAHRAENR